MEVRDRTGQEGSGVVGKCLVGKGRVRLVEKGWEGPKCGQSFRQRIRPQASLKTASVNTIRVI